MNLPANFLNDIQGKDTSLIPLVVFTDLDIFISTNNLSVDGQYFQPILLNIPSIKQSVDIENRRFKISSVTLSISNYEYEGSRFSDLLQNTSMINKEVCVYWKSQTSTTLDTGQDTDCPKIYAGKIRRISHTTDTVTVELEDSTESNAHKDLPQEFISDSENILEKYRNKPIPIVYGEVDKSPIVIDGSKGGYTGVIDSMDFNGLYSLNNEVFGDLSSLAIVKDETTLSVPETTEYLNMDYYEELILNPDIISDQWRFNDNRIVFMPTILSMGNFMQTKSIFKPTNVQLRITENVSESYGTSNNFGLNEDGDLFQNIYNEEDGISLTDNNYENPDYENTIQQLNGDLNLEGDFALTSKATLVIDVNKSVNSKEQKHIQTAINGIKLLNRSIAILPNGTPDDGVFSQANLILLRGATSSPANPLHHEYHIAGVNSQGGGDGGGDFENWWYQLVSFNQDEGEFSNHNPDAPLQINDVGVDTTAFTGESTGSVDVNMPIVFFEHLKHQQRIHLVHRVKISGAQDVSGSVPVQELTNTVNLGIKEIDCMSYVDIESPFANNFYVSVKGRTSETLSESIMIGDDEVLLALENPAVIIRHILEEELGYTDFDEGDYQEAVHVHENMKYGFTVHDKQISSKKLIEDIAKSTLMFPHFGNDGKFKFNSLKENYSQEDIENSEVIPASEVIDYSFSKTKPEQIYSKYEVDYYYDYAQKSYLKKVSDNFSITDSLHQEFYGFEGSDDNIGKLESAYIRDEQTAKKLNGLLFNYYKNQHLTLKLKLPVKYIGLSVGDTVRFDELLGGITAYGVDYTVESFPNGQQVYPLFYITSLQKNIDNVSVELIQLHNITYQMIGDFTYIDADLPDRVFTPTNNEQQFKFTFNNEQFIIEQSLTDSNLLQLFSTNNWNIVFEDGSATLLSSFNDLLPDGVSLTNAGDTYTLLEMWVLNENEDEYIGSLVKTFVGIDFFIDDNYIPLILTNDSVIKLVIPEIDEGITFVYNPPNSIVSGVQEAVYVPEEETDDNGDNNGVGLGAGSGDVTENGLVDILDLVSVVAFALGNHDYSQSQIDAADVNGDGVVNILDVVQMVNIVLEN